MSTLLDGRIHVHSNGSWDSPDPDETVPDPTELPSAGEPLDDAPFEPDAEDLDFLREITRDWEPEPLDAVEWLESQRESHQDRDRRDPLGILCVVRDTIDDLIAELEARGHWSAAAYLADPRAPHCGIDLERMLAPGPRRHSRLAEGLDIEEAWYRHQETSAASLLAYELSMAADEAEEYGAADVAELAFARIKARECDPAVIADACPW